MTLLDRLPIADRPRVVTVGGDAIQVNRNQIVAWISVGDVSKPFPAVLDTGHGHNLSISARHLARWGGSLGEEIGELVIDGRPVLQHAADVRIHRNRPGMHALRGDSYPLETPQGISVMPDEMAPRLPLIGLRLIVVNKLRLVIKGKRGEVTLKTGWI